MIQMPVLTYSEPRDEKMPFECDSKGRPEELLERAIIDRIDLCDYSEIRRIRCELRDNRFLLQGQVSSFHMKQVAQEIVRSIARHTRIENAISVKRPHISYIAPDPSTDLHSEWTQPVLNLPPQTLRREVIANIG